MLGGATLNKLNSLRTTYYVYIDWDSNKRAIRVSADSPQGDVVSALKGVRQAFKNAEAQETYSKPLYIIVPPKEDTMRKIVEPAFLYDDNTTRGAKPAGDLLSEREKSAWKANIEQHLEKNQEDFEDHLRKVTGKLTHFMAWMRMRVHFGHVCLEKSQLKFRKSESNFEEFVRMMKHSRLTGTLDRK
jgi:hypothetical protein